MTAICIHPLLSYNNKITPVEGAAAAKERIEEEKTGIVIDQI